MMYYGAGIPSMISGLQRAVDNLDGMATGSGKRGGTPATAAVARDLAALTERFDRLVLLNAAMWVLLQEKTSLTEEDLVKKVQEIDLRDGVADGKVTRTVKKCANCGRMISKRHNRCLFCGGDVLEDATFEGV